MNEDTTVIIAIPPKTPANHGLSRYKAKTATTKNKTRNKKAKNIPHQFIRHVFRSEFFSIFSFSLSI